MVTMSKALLKDTFRSIWRTKARFISIILIVALGIGFFAGIKATAPDMKETANRYFLSNNLMDLRVLSTVGFEQADVDAIREIDGVHAVMPAYFADGLVKVNGESLIDMDGSAFSVRAHSLSMEMLADWQNGKNDAEYMNRPTLIEGEWPKNANECLVDRSELSTPDEFQIGSTITIESDREDLNSSMETTEFKIVGIVESPYYISFERGNSLVGSGKVGAFILVPDTAFKTDYYTDLYMKVNGTTKSDFDSYGDAYEKLVQPVVEQIEAIGQDRAPVRAEVLRPEMTATLEQARLDYAQAEVDTKQKIEDARKSLDEALEFAENGDQILAEKQQEFNDSLSAAQREFASGKAEHSAGLNTYYQRVNEYNLAVSKLAEAKQTVANSQREYDKNKEKLDAAEKQINSAKSQISNGENQIRLLKQMIATAETVAGDLGSSNNASYEELIKRAEEIFGPDSTVVKQLKELSNITAGGMVQEAAQALSKYLGDYKDDLAKEEEKLAKAKADLKKGEADYATNEKTLKAAKAKLDAANAEINAKQAQLDASKRQLDSAQSELQQAGFALDVGELTLSSKQSQALMEIEQAKQKLKEAKQAAVDGEETYQKAKAEAENELSRAKLRLSAGEQKLNDLSSAKWVVSDRDDIPGFTGYGQTADRTKAFAQVFPIFFFLIAALICLTTMTRMVEEERTQLGTLKALGYDNKAIVSKYIIYAILASLIGSVIGLAVGFVVLPLAISAAYGIMYTLPTVHLQFILSYALIGTAIAILSTVGATFLACYKELATCPAQLMRPRAPKAGKRVLLEKIPFIWKHLNFTSKVTVRNIFRNKRRFLMTAFGVAGCTALLLTGFGLNDSISAIINKQFNDGGIAMYDAQLVLKDPVLTDGSAEAPIITQLKENDGIQNAMLTYMKVLHGHSERSDEELEVNVLVPQNNAQLSDFVRLQNRQSGAQLTLPDDGVLITEKLASKTDTEVGDELIVTKSDGSEVRLKVAGITENYTFHYVYISQALYEQAFGEEAQFNYVMAQLKDDIKNEKPVADGQENNQKGQLATELMKMPEINAVVYTTQTIDTFNNVINALTLVVVVFIIAAAALAFVVLYNLSNININERVRELATIKVLGFYDKEVDAYIYRENVFLTVIGIALGLVMGIFLHRFVVSVAEVDVVMFGRTISWLSYVLGAAMTALFAVIVNWIMHFRLKKISMVESLKSVE